MTTLRHDRRPASLALDPLWAALLGLAAGLSLGMQLGTQPGPLYALLALVAGG